MIPGTLGRVHEALLGCGWIVVSASARGLPDERDVVAALEPALVPDPRGPGKLHARDVVRYDRGPGKPVSDVYECESVAHVDGTDDYSRFELAEDGRTLGIGGRILELAPPPMRRVHGRMSADYFRYSPGTRSDAHQDKFGDLVVIWVLARNGGGAESFLTTLEGKDVLRGPIAAGQVLVFRDDMFLHGLTPLTSGERGALIFITLKDGAS